jgi:hypothetical protein
MEYNTDEYLTSLLFSVTRRFVNKALNFVPISPIKLGFLPYEITGKKFGRYFSEKMRSNGKISTNLVTLLSLQ